MLSIVDRKVNPVSDMGGKKVIMAFCFGFSEAHIFMSFLLTFKSHSLCQDLRWSISSNVITSFPQSHQYITITNDEGDYLSHSLPSSSFFLPWIPLRLLRKCSRWLSRAVLFNRTFCYDGNDLDMLCSIWQPLATCGY